LSVKKIHVLVLYRTALVIDDCKFKHIILVKNGAIVHESTKKRYSRWHETLQIILLSFATFI
jgi:hypothetical protein